MASHFTATEAARELGVSVSTLYAYVSRGLVRSDPDGGSGRERRYDAGDVRRLKTRQEHRRDPGKAAERALHWGSPVLESGIAEIRDGRLYYRGRDAVTLAESYGAEAVAQLLWTGQLPEECRPNFQGSPPAYLADWRPLVADLLPLERFEVLLPLVAAADPAAHDLRPAQIVKSGYRILRAMAQFAGGGAEPGPETEGIAHQLQQQWAPQFPQAGPLIDRALVLCADHELNTSTFTARCVASTGASPYAVVLAGLCALQGVRHGGNTERVTDFMRTLAPGESPASLISRYLRRGEAVPGFGHPLYPAGDPRARALLDAVYLQTPFSGGQQRARVVEVAMAELMETRPNLDFALVALAECLELPAGAPLAMFAIGRTLGWLAHALEQYASGEMIRPRARYTGPAPHSF